MRRRARRLAFGLSTLLGLRRHGFFIPYRYAHGVLPAGDRGAYEAIEPIFTAAEPTFAAFLEAMDTHAESLNAIGSDKPPEPRWNQDWFPRLDACAAYVMIREARPARVVEVGSGHSTRFMCRAVRDGALATEVIAIDPAPRASIEASGAVLIQSTLQEAGISPFLALRSGDVLFIDSSHILMPGTDVDFLLNRVLPALPAGVMVHVHDIFLPDDYPAEWDWRGYNEQLGVSALMQGRGYRLLWSSHYAATRMADSVAASVAGTLELKPSAFESSVWLVKA